MKAPICSSRVSFGQFFSKLTYLVGFLWNKWLLYILFLVYLDASYKKESINYQI